MHITNAFKQISIFDDDDINLTLPGFLKHSYQVVGLIQNVLCVFYEAHVVE